MAKIISPLVEVGSGSIGGLTLLRGPQHQVIVRQRTVPVNPDTPSQQKIRTAMSSAVGYWEALDDEGRTAWEEWATTLTWQTKLGNSYTPSGRLAFIQIRALVDYLTNLGLQAQVDRMTPGSEPNGLPAPYPTSAKPTAAEIGIRIEVENPLEYPVSYHVQISPQISAGTNFYKGPYKATNSQILVATQAATTGVQFLDLEDGGKYAWVARPFNQDVTDQAMRMASMVRGIRAAELGG